ncbi:MEDS domain-containing protein [Kineosporia sp. A_224]|uniref:MEDS domain-containing protein n=1 Tax=Kineosporia sp. A_224 TaxID=1962180 RepID=UPI001303FD86|nr:MEDS domain-containing protein [Kineosporia sp. A_224]
MPRQMPAQMPGQLPRQVGATDVALEAGDHVCGFYYGDDERDAMLLPFLRGGLEAGDKCLAVVDSTAPKDVIAGIGEGLDVDGLLASGQLELYDSDETYLRTGTFDPERMIEFWEDHAAAESATGRFAFARVVGEMSWLERVPPLREHVVRYETWADGFAAKFPHAILCLYDLRRLGSGILLDLMRTHPKLLLGGLVLENPHHLSGDEFAAARA